MVLEYKKSTLHYSISGKGSALVLLHGFLENGTMWNTIVLELSKNHKVICIDLLGHGKTDCIGYVHTMEDMAEAVEFILNHHNIESAHVVGHSMGGYVALALAEKKPKFFNGLCLMNSTFEADDEQLKAKRTLANQMAKTNFENLVRVSFSNLFAENSKTEFKTEYEDALKIALQTSVQSYIAASEGMRLRPNRFEIFNNLKAKKLIIIGKKDAIINSEALIHQLKNTTINYCVLSEGHMSYIENKIELLECFYSFLSDNSKNI